MEEQEQSDLFSPVNDLGLVRFLLADLHDDLPEKIARFRQITDLSSMLGSNGTMLTGGETTYTAWTEARTSFIHGNYVATVMLCQGLAEHILASYLELGNFDENLPDRITFQETMRRSLLRNIITQQDADDLRKLMNLRNPLSHYRNIDDPSNLTRRVLDTRVPAMTHLRADAGFAISMAIRLLALPTFRLGD
ncbi:hypothetical protein GFL54_34915 [Rhizobium laguerreae]|uniref:hypothetical protein n=1 Tax=Rhizobium laguerreae TaxID=1076926 RepID=UPI00143F364E|nr:hypothetical protein [Rhizobium laguerreae]NKM89312.1 hypothetical protein [Rhizobium laguerreae]